MRRRELIAFLASAAALSPAAFAQPTSIRRVGILSDESASLGAITFQPFAQRLRDIGYIEGRDIAFERRYAGGDAEALESFAAELVRLQPDVIFAIGTPAAQAAKSATQRIPIVFARTGDPVGSGLVAALSRPGGNLTGLSILTTETGAKRCELLAMAVPEAKRVGLVWDPRFQPALPEFKEIEETARALNLALVPTSVRGPDDFEPALAAIVRQRADAVILGSSVIFVGYWQRMAELTVQARLPAIFYRREFVEAGGLMSFGTNYTDMYRRAAAYVDKILRGAHPADLPVEQPTKFELVINLKSAKTIGLAIPPMLLARADEVIE
jgi:putative tryptophan/tyrosine transport system substrate-binding protein